MAKKNSQVPNGLPTYDELMWPVIVTLKEMGGAATTSDLIARAAEKLKLSEEALNYRREGKSRDEIFFRSDWTKWYLRKAGLVDYQDKLWVLQPQARKLTEEEEVQAIPAAVRKAFGKKGENTDPSTASEEEEPNVGVEEALFDGWRNELSDVLEKMDPTAFERLCMALLIKSGFEEVSVTQRSNDKGIDGKGILRLNLISFRVLFQAKRYKNSNSVQGPEIRNFQASLGGRADKGIFITTGRFTAGAVAEASRDGGAPVELINGEMLCELLKKYSIGVEIKMVESVSIDKNFFDQI